VNDSKEGIALMTEVSEGIKEGTNKASARHSGCTQKCRSQGRLKEVAAASGVHVGRSASEAYFVVHVNNKAEQFLQWDLVETRMIYENPSPPWSRGYRHIRPCKYGLQNGSKHEQSAGGPCPSWRWRRQLPSRTRIP